MKFSIHFDHSSGIIHVSEHAIRCFVSRRGFKPERAKVSYNPWTGGDFVSFAMPGHDTMMSAEVKKGVWTIRNPEGFGIC